MRRIKFAVAVAVTSLGLLSVIGLVAVLTTPVGALAAQTALAAPPWKQEAGFGPFPFGGPGFTLPPELAGLIELPPAERFAHFVGVQVNLRDKDGQPFTVNVVPGTTAAASANSLTIDGNDGVTRTFTLDEYTTFLGKASATSAQDKQPVLTNGAQVVVVTFNGDITARFVISCDEDSFAPGRFGGPPWARFGPFHR